MKACGTPPSRRMYATAPLPSRARSMLPTETTSAFGPSSAVAGNQSARAVAAGTSTRMAVSRTNRRDKTAPGRGAPPDCNRREGPKLRRGEDALFARLLAEGLGLARAAGGVPAELATDRRRDAVDGVRAGRE